MFNSFYKKIFSNEENFYQNSVFLFSYISLMLLYLSIFIFPFFNITREIVFVFALIINTLFLIILCFWVFYKKQKIINLFFIFVSFLIFLYFDVLSHKLISLSYASFNFEFEIFSYMLVLKLFLFYLLTIFCINILFLIKICVNYIFFEKTESLKEKIFVAVKGCLIGGSDLVPGISGGSISFILGIYDRWIKAISNITTKNFFDVYYNFLRFRFIYVHKKFIKCDTYFLIFIGIFLFLSIYLFSKVLNKLLSDLYIFIMSFFFGIILFSSIDMYRHTQKKDEKNLLFIAFGFLFVCLIFFFIEPSSLFKKEGVYLFLAGFISLAAMLVPGFSGAYILILLGVYEDIILYISNIKTYYVKLVPFYLGVIFGFFTVSKVINFFLTKYYSKTISTLLGLMVGGLVFISHGVISEIEKFSFILFFEIIFFIGLGFFTIKLLEKLKIAEI